jgi:hypothetical protein
MATNKKLDLGHMGAQFAKTLQDVNDAFDIEYGPTPTVATVAGLRVPVSRGRVSTYGLRPDWNTVSLDIPDARGNLFHLSMNPETGGVYAGDYGEAGYTPGSLEEFADVYQSARPLHPSRRGIPQALVRQGVAATRGGRYLLGQNTNKSQVYEGLFDPRTSQIVEGGRT